MDSVLFVRNDAQGKTLFLNSLQTLLSVRKPVLKRVSPTLKHVNRLTGETSEQHAAPALFFPAALAHENSLQSLLYCVY